MESGSSALHNALWVCVSVYICLSFCVCVYVCVCFCVCEFDSTLLSLNINESCVVSCQSYTRYVAVQ